MIAAAPRPRTDLSAHESRCPSRFWKVEGLLIKSQSEERDEPRVEAMVWHRKARLAEERAT